MDEDKIPIELIGKHPHTGVKGYLTIIDGQTDSIMVIDTLMRKVTFDEPHYGVEACYAEDKNIRKVSDQPKSRTRANAPKGQVSYPRKKNL